jgi:hypothetical protein
LSTTGTGRRTAFASKRSSGREVIDATRYDETEHKTGNVVLIVVGRRRS